MYSRASGQISKSTRMRTTRPRFIQKVAAWRRGHGTRTPGCDVPGWGYADGNSGLFGSSEFFQGYARAYSDSNRGGK